MERSRWTGKTRGREPAAVRATARADETPTDVGAAWHRSPRMVAQRQAIQRALGPQGPADGASVTQLLSKRWKNVLTLGIRRAYVEIKRAVRAAPAPQAAAAVPMAAPVVDEQERFAQAYEQSRHYHSTLDPDNLPSIEQHGLLNQKDRVGALGQDVGGFSTRYRDSEFNGDEKKGVFVGTRALVEENRSMLGDNVARAFLPQHRSRKVRESEASDEELFHDPKFPGPAYITRASIAPEIVTTTAMLDLLDRDDPKVTTILQSVASQYDDGPPPDLETMKNLLREAIRTRRLSNAALDNLPPP